MNRSHGDTLIMIDSEENWTLQLTYMPQSTQVNSCKKTQRASYFMVIVINHGLVFEFQPHWKHHTTERPREQTPKTPTTQTFRKYLKFLPSFLAPIKRSSRSHRDSTLNPLHAVSSRKMQGTRARRTVLPTHESRYIHIEQPQNSRVGKKSPLHQVGPSRARCSSRSALASRATSSATARCCVAASLSNARVLVRCCAGSVLDEADDDGSVD